MRVLKFGGSSLATPERIQEVARIVLDEARSEPLVIVVSAFQGVTNQLLDAANLSERGDAGAERVYEKIAARRPNPGQSGRAARRAARRAPRHPAARPLPSPRARRHRQLR